LREGALWFYEFNDLFELILSNVEGPKILLLSVAVVGLLKVRVEEVKELALLNLDLGVLDSSGWSWKFILFEEVEVLLHNLETRSDEQSTIVSEVLRHFYLRNSVVLVSRIGSVLNEAELSAILSGSVNFLQTNHIKFSDFECNFISSVVRRRVVNHKLGDLFSLRKVSAVGDDSRGLVGVNVCGALALAFVLSIAVANRFTRHDVFVSMFGLFFWRGERLGLSEVLLHGFGVWRVKENVIGHGVGAHDWVGRVVWHGLRLRADHLSDANLHGARDIFVASHRSRCNIHRVHCLVEVVGFHAILNQFQVVFVEPSHLKVHTVGVWLFQVRAAHIVALGSLLKIRGFYFGEVEVFSTRLYFLVLCQENVVISGGAINFVLKLEVHAPIVDELLSL
jgi:hypothetical protein